MQAAWQAVVLLGVPLGGLTLTVSVAKASCEFLASQERQRRRDELQKATLADAAERARAWRDRQDWHEAMDRREAEMDQAYAAAGYVKYGYNWYRPEDLALFRERSLQEAAQREADAARYEDERRRRQAEYPDLGTGRLVRWVRGDVWPGMAPRDDSGGGYGDGPYQRIVPRNAEEERAMYEGWLEALQAGEGLR